MARKLFTSESVTEGHPDKICDQISDAVLDAILAEDKNGRVACECCCTTGMVMIMGEITTSAKIDIPSIARRVICDIGYDSPEKGFDGHTCAILTTIDKQSPDIALGVDRQGAGDQGMMFGYACRETPELMPLPISLAHKLAAQLTKVRADGTLPYLRPDGKTQVTVEYAEDGTPVRIDAVVVSSQHAAYIETETLRRDIEKNVIREIIPADMMDDKTKIFINPTGRFVTGGPQGDSGLTGRKIIVDTYGGYSRHGGGAFSGKDPTKVDRSAAYAARYMAKNIVAAGLADKCEVEIAYAIGVAHPVSVLVETFGTGKVDDGKLEEAVEKVFDLRPTAIIRDLDLRRPIYRQLAAYGHMGREDLGVTWEKTDRVAALLEGSTTQLVDTRKTTPNMRVFEKEAVRCGGGRNHRYNLSDGVLLKDNHIAAAGGVREAIEAARAHAPFVREIEVECETFAQVEEAIAAGADIIMLDNMGHDAMAAAVAFIDGRAKTECSGNIDAHNVQAIADLGIDFVSSGALTHSAPILDVSMKHLRMLDGNGEAATADDNAPVTDTHRESEQ